MNVSAQEKNVCKKRIEKEGRDIGTIVKKKMEEFVSQLKTKKKEMVLHMEKERV